MSESRQAEIFRRRQTQQRPSFELGDVSDSQTTHFAMIRRGRSFNTSALAPSMIWGAMTGSGVDCGLRFKGCPRAHSYYKLCRCLRGSRNRS